MSVYLIQHGKCIEKSENTERPLSKDGVVETREIAKKLKKLSLNVGKVFHSGKLRSEETAKILSEILSDGKVTLKEQLCPNDNPDDFCKDFSLDNSIYVGHLPHLEKVVSKLITGTIDTRVVRFQNSGVVCLDKDERGYFIKWYVTPYN